MKIIPKVSEDFSMALCAFSMLLFSAQNMSLPKNLIRQVFADREENVEICHRTNAIKNPYRQITVDVSSIDGIGNGDHYLEHQGPLFATGMANGDDWGDIIPPVDDAHSGLNWTAGQDIYTNDCKVPGLPECEETISCPTACDYEGGTVQGDCGEIECDATNSCEEDPTPTPTPTPTPEIGEEHSSLHVNRLDCYEYDFKAEMDLKNDGNPIQDVLVAFSYNGIQKNAYTNKDGRASVDFTFTGKAIVKATPNNGYPAQETKATQETNCQEIGGMSKIETNISNSDSRVLGANTYAKTGIFEDVMMSIVGLSGATMTAVGAKLNAKKKK